MLKILLLVIFFCVHSLADVYYYEYGKKVTLSELKSTRANSLELLKGNNIKYYQNSHGQKMGVKNEILTQCQEDINCSNIFSSYDLTEIKNLTSSILLISLKPDQDPFEISQKLSKEKDIIFAHPNFIKKRKRR
jgi:hypothetical protein